MRHKWLTIEKNVPIAFILSSRWRDGAESLGIETASCLCYNYWKLYFNQEIAQSKSHTSIKHGPQQMPIFVYFCSFLITWTNLAQN